MHGSRLSDLRNVLLSAFTLAVTLTGCGTGGGNITPQPSVAVSGASQVRLGSTTSFSATVTILTNTAVTWQVNGVTGGNSSVGTITAAGVYTPPAVLPTTDSVTVTAVSVASPTASGSAQLSLLNPVPVLASATATLISGTSYSLEAVGSSFASGAQIEMGGVAQSTTFVSATNLQATVSIPSGTTTLMVTVMNPNPGAVASNSASATIYLASTTAASRLLDQATFGPTLADIHHVENVGQDAYII